MSVGGLEMEVLSSFSTLPHISSGPVTLCGMWVYILK